jgi:hypothetical protein
MLFMSFFLQILSKSFSLITECLPYTNILPFPLLHYNTSLFIPYNINLKSKNG